MKIEIIAGSPRQNSTTFRVALHLQKQLQAATEHEIGIIDVRENNLPLLQKVFVSVNETPEPFKQLASRIFSADAFILITPEYNGSYTPALKNLLDHFPKQHRKTFGIVTASPGATGGMRAAMQLQQLVYGFFGIGSPYMLVTPMVDKKFDTEGNLVDDSFKKAVDLFLREFIWLAEKLVEAKVEVE